MPGESTSISRSHLDEKTVFLAKWCEDSKEAERPCLRTAETAAAKPGNPRLCCL